MHKGTPQAPQDGPSESEHVRHQYTQAVRIAYRAVTEEIRRSEMMERLADEGRRGLPDEDGQVGTLYILSTYRWRPKYIYIYI